MKASMLLTWLERPLPLQDQDASPNPNHPSKTHHSDKLGIHTFGNEERGMVKKERESYILKEKGKKANQLIGEAMNMKHGEGGLRPLQNTPFKIKEFSEEDISKWIEATDQSRILGKALDTKVTKGQHGKGNMDGAVFPEYHQAVSRA